MSALEARDPGLLRGYEGLVFATAAKLASELRWRGVATADDDLDDIMQLLRMKVWKSLGYWNPSRVRRKRGESIAAARDRYVFMCVYDTAKDIAKRKRIPALMIEDFAPAHYLEEEPRDSFNARYLSQSQEDAYCSVEEEPPLIPNTLSELERNVMLLLYRDYTHREMASRLGVSKGDISTAVRGLRAKLGDWQPAAPAVDPLTIASV